jgi:hypothetical protein
LGIGDWGLGPIPNPQSPIPNPQSPIPNIIIEKHKNKIKYTLNIKILSYNIIIFNLIIK